MANDNKRSKSFGSKGKKQAAAKRAIKKQQKNGSKFKNAEMRADLDSQIHILYSVGLFQYLWCLRSLIFGRDFRFVDRVTK
jgi:hypothetical protein